MKYIVAWCGIILFAVITMLYMRMELIASSESNKVYLQVIKQYSLDGYSSYEVCIRGNKWIVSGSNYTQMMEESLNLNLTRVTVPVPCIDQ